MYFDTIIHNHVGLHLLIGISGSDKTFFVKYLAQHFQLSHKMVLMCATMGFATLQLSPTASTAHTLFRIPSQGCLSPLQEPSTVLERLCFFPKILIIVSKLLGFHRQVICKQLIVFLSFFLPCIFFLSLNVVKFKFETQAYISLKPKHSLSHLLALSSPNLLHTHTFICM